jgi:hypothetical protein
MCCIIMLALPSKQSVTHTHTHAAAPTKRDAPVGEVKGVVLPVMQQQGAAVADGAVHTGVMMWPQHAACFIAHSIAKAGCMMSWAVVPRSWLMARMLCII